MAQYLFDTFTGTVDTNLTAHDPDVGDAASWNTTGGTLELDGAGHCRSDASVSIDYGWNDTTHASEDYEVEVKAVLGGATDDYIIGATARASSNTHMYIAWIKGNGGFQLKSRTSSSTGSDLVTEVTGVTLSPSALYSVFLKVEGTTITARLVRDSDQVELVNVSTTDATHSAGGFGVISRHPTSDIHEVDVNDIAAVQYTYTTDVFVNNSGTVLASQSVDWSWWPNGRAGAFGSTDPEEGTDTTDGSGNLTIDLVSNNAGCLLAKVAQTDATDDWVYYEAGTPS